MAPFEKLGEANRASLEELLGREYLEQSQEDALTTREVEEANEALAHRLYGDDVAKLVIGRSADRVSRLNRMNRDAMESVSLPASALDGVDLDAIGVVLVRPEVLGISEKFSALLRGSGLEVAIDKKIDIEFLQYWGLYHHGLIDEQSHYDFPTRTLNYIGRECRLLVVKGHPKDFKSESVSAYLTEELKGTQGSYSPRTLRGDIGFRALSQFIGPKHTLSQPATIPLDPIGAYRKLTRGEVPSDNAHATADIPLLFYAGQSVHVPNRLELGRDMRILCTEEDISLLKGE